MPIVIIKNKLQLTNFDNKSRQNIYCFDCKIAFRPFVLNNSANLIGFDYGGKKIPTLVSYLDKI